MTEIRATNVVWHEGHVERPRRQRLLGQKGCTVWLTGLPSSGKSTIGFSLEHALIEQGRLSYVLDGDNIRHGLNKNLGFSAEDRAENIRRIGEVAKLFADAGAITVTSFISPYRADRDMVRKLHDDAGIPFVEVFVDTPIEVCEQRDPKGFYAKARSGQIKQFTGVSDPYEAPEKPEVVLKNGQAKLEESIATLLKYLGQRGLLAASQCGCGCSPG
jgi:adenylylsulfate kinase